MIYGVITHYVSFTDHPFHQIGIFLKIGHCDKECRSNIVFLEDIQYYRCIPVFIPLIKSQIDYLSGGIPQVDCIVFICQFDELFSCCRRQMIISSDSQRLFVRVFPPILPSSPLQALEKPNLFLSPAIISFFDFP